MFTDIHNCCMLLGTADDILILCHKSRTGIPSARHTGSIMP